MVYCHRHFSPLPRPGRRLLLYCLLFCLGPLWHAFGAEWYVAPDATREGTGAKTNPWTFQTATDRITPIRPGDVLWLRGGIYQSNFLSYLTGEPNRHITVRSYPNERVIFNGSPLFPTAFPLTIEGAWTIYRDFEIIHSATWTTTLTPVAIQCLGSNVKLVNLVIHDAGQGIGFWKEAVDSEIYGCILYYNGADPQEHGIYTQNETGTKRIHDSIIFHNSGFGIHAYAQNGYARGYDIHGNVLFQNGRENGELFVGSFHPTDRLSVVSNYCVASPELTAPAFRLNDRDHSSNPNGSAVVRDNIIVGGAGFTAQDFTDLTFVNNLVLSLFQQTHCRPPPGRALSSYNWNDNRYYGISAFSVGPTNYDFAAWRSLSGLDGRSSYDPAFPTGLQVFVRPNLYEPKRANIIIYNWDLHDTVSVDVSSLLQPGDRFELRNVHDYLGAPVISNVFAGGPLVVPMTNLAVALPRRNVPAPAHTGPFFGAFVLRVPYVRPAELVARWGMDEGSGSSTRESMHRVDGTLVNAPTWIPGRTGNALRFAPGDAVNVPDSPHIDMTNDISLSMWFKPSRLLNGSSGRQDLIAKYISYWVILNYPFDDGRISFGFNSGSPFVRSTRTSWNFNEWYHLVGTFNGTEMKLYINGVLEGETATTFRILNTPYALQLGGNTIQHIYYPGALDEVRLYNYALSEAEVVQLFENPCPTNVAPSLPKIADQFVMEETTLSLPIVAVDPNPASPLTFSLEANPPSGAFINPNTGLFTWTPTEAQGPFTNFITVRVTDNDIPNLSTAQSFKVVVNEANRPPQFASIATQTIAEESTLVLFDLASDPDIPANTLTFNFVGPVPENVRVNAFGGGVFVWTPTEAQGPSTNVIRIRATDSGFPSLSATQTFTVVVTEIPRRPILPILPNRAVTVGETLTFPAGATDPDLPANVLRYNLSPGAPATSFISSFSGIFTWTPATPSTNVITIQVADDGTPPQTDSRSFTVAVFARPVILSATRQGAVVTLNWSAAPGRSYRVQYKQNLQDPAWADLPGEVTAVNFICTTSDVLTPSQQRFYRIMVVP